MSPASFKILLDAPEAPPPPSKPVNPAALTREERHNNGWHVRFIAWVLGLPSILSIAFVCLSGSIMPSSPRETQRPGWRFPPASW